MLVVAPLCFLLPVVAMLTVCRRSLPSLQQVERIVEIAPTERRPLRLLDVAVSVLVPFMAVYSSYGLLEQDLFRFRNVAAADVFTRTTLSVRPEDLDGAGRLGIYTLQVALLIVVGAWLVRFALGKVERTLKLRALAYAGAFVEVYYTAQLAGQLVVLKVNGLPWLEDRVAVQWLQSGYDAVVDFLGPVAGAFKAGVHGVEAVLGSFDAVVVVPVGWLGAGGGGARLQARWRRSVRAAPERRGMLPALAGRPPRALVRPARRRAPARRGRAGADARLLAGLPAGHPDPAAPSTRCSGRSWGRGTSGPGSPSARSRPRWASRSRSR